jgi:hypothetical protein
MDASRIEESCPDRCAIALGDRPDRATPSPRRAIRIAKLAFSATPRTFWRLRHRHRRRAAASIIAQLQGDPPPGRSALDHLRRMEEATNVD